MLFWESVYFKGNIRPVKMTDINLSEYRDTRKKMCTLYVTKLKNLLFLVMAESNVLPSVGKADLDNDAFTGKKKTMKINWFIKLLV